MSSLGQSEGKDTFMKRIKTKMSSNELNTALLNEDHFEIEEIVEIEENENSNEIANSTTNSRNQIANSTTNSRNQIANSTTNSRNQIANSTTNSRNQIANSTTNSRNQIANSTTKNRNQIVNSTSKVEQSKGTYQNLYLLVALIDLEFSPSVYESLGNTIYLKKICENLTQQQKRHLYDLC